MASSWIAFLLDPIKRCLPIISSACCNSGQNFPDRNDEYEIPEDQKRSHPPPSSAPVHFTQSNQQSQKIGAFVRG